MQTLRPNCKLSPIQSQDNGWGFVVRGERDKPLISLNYETAAEVDEARRLMARVILLAAITPLPQ